MDLMEAISGKLEKELRELFDERLAATGAYDISIHPDSDHHGDPIVYVEVKHRLVEPIDVEDVIDADQAARALAWTEGERRFVHVRHIFDEKQKVVPQKAAKAARAK